MGERERYLASWIRDDLDGGSMVFLGGPRQVGKTTLAKSLLSKLAARNGATYLNWDIDGNRSRILAKDFPREGWLVLDEIHKFRRWRNWLKGLHDELAPALRILVTGSARLDLYRYGGESLQGRYHCFRLHPLSVAEIRAGSDDDVRDLLRLGGFPAPFLSGSERKARRWSREYRVRLIRDEVPKLEAIEDLGSLELLALRLPALVGSPLSINNLREDLDRAHKTIAGWIFVLEKLYHVFPVLPLARSTLRAVKKERKFYLFDWSLVEEDGPRFENFVASHLLKWVHYQQDVEGLRYDLRYYRDRDGREVDFVVLLSDKPVLLVEAKVADTEVSPSLRFLHRRFPAARAVQVTLATRPSRAPVDGIEIRPALDFLRELV